MSVEKKVKKVKEIVPKEVTATPKVNDTYKFLKNPTGFTNLAYSENMVLSQEGISNIPKETMDKMIEKGYIAKI